MARENEDPVEPEVHNMDELNQKETPSANVPADANLVWKAFSIVFMMIAVAYAALPFDAFPDAVPVIGWLDDAAVLIAAGLNMFQQFSRDQNSPTVKLVRKQRLVTFDAVHVYPPPIPYLPFLYQISFLL